MPDCHVNGTRLHYERHGGGEPLLLVTGFTISSAVFEPVLELYGGRFECIAYDNRASGRSAVPLRPTAMPELAADAAALLRAIGVESAHVYGLSMGGMIAQELAIRFPEGSAASCSAARRRAARGVVLAADRVARPARADSRRGAPDRRRRPGRAAHPRTGTPDRGGPHGREPRRPDDRQAHEKGTARGV